jgi:MFS transporter, ACS family, tartrate transporter
MMTWGVLAAAMMLVRTPWEFYTLRLLLGIAEAGFFPGIVYYLTLWFPAQMRARAVSRFYIALPLSSVVMGSLAGWLMGLDSRFGLTGWQWLFLAEGIPSVLFSVVILRMLPDGPAQAGWLTAEEKLWLERTLRADGARAQLGHGTGVMKALLEPNVWLMGLFFFCVLTCNYAYNFSAPAIFQAATGWSVGRIGLLVAAIGITGAVSMLLGGAHSDSKRERALHCIVPCCTMGAAFAAASYAPTWWLLVAALWVSFAASCALQAPALAIPTEFLAGRAAAAGIAAMNSIALFSGFVGPYWMGRIKDATGSYSLGLRGLIVPSLVAAGMMIALSLRLTQSNAASAAALAEEPALKSS